MRYFVYLCNLEIMSYPHRTPLQRTNYETCLNNTSVPSSPCISCTRGNEFRSAADAERERADEEFVYGGEMDR